MGGQVERAADILRKGGMRQSYHEQDGKIIIRTSQDVEPHLEYCKQARREERESIGRFGSVGEFHRTMSTPQNIYYAVCTKLGIPLRKIFDSDVAKRIDKELKRPLFKGFRTTERRI